MIRILIVDDEPNIRQGLTKIIDWKEQGLEICGEAENGQEGLEKVKQLQPDICIVDIKMPRMTGLEMIRELSNLDYHCERIILSGYSDFSYAREGMKYGLTSYLLKPIDKTELIIVLNQAKERIYKEREKVAYINEIYNMSKDKIMENVFNGAKIDLRKIEEVCRLNLPWSTYQVAIIEFNQEIEFQQKGLLLQEVQNYISRQNYGFVFEIEGEMVVLFKDICSYIKIPLDYLRQLIANTTDSDFIMGVGKQIDAFSLVKLSYQSAKAILKNKFIENKTIFIYDHIIANHEPTSNNPLNIVEIIDRLYCGIEMNNLEVINDVLEEMKNTIMCYQYSEEKIKAIYINLYVTIITELMNKNENLENSKYINNNIFNEINTQQTLQRLHGFVKHQLVFISDEMSSENPKNFLRKIMDYVDKNYNRELKLEELALVFNYNSAYLGKQFKNYTGEYFNDYINRVRINKAKSLIENTDLKIYQISKKVGYKTQDYFTMKFKAQEGLSPNQYRKKINN